MEVRRTYGIREYVRIGALVLLLTGFIVPCSMARNALRFNVDFSYARDFSRAGVGPSAIEGMTPAEAMEWVGAGKTESLMGSNGFAPAIGFGYRFMHHMFMMDLGLGAEYRYRINRPYGMMDLTDPAIDNTNTPYIGHHYWTDRQMHCRHLGVTLPIMFGVEWRKLYVMAGVKAGLDIWGRSKEKGVYSMKAEYEQYMDILENIPGHGIVEKDPYTMPDVTMSAGWNVRACAEVGYWINGDQGRAIYNRKSIEPRYYISAFAEYGFIGAGGTYLPLLAGVRLTALLMMPEKQECKCYNW